MTVCSQSPPGTSLWLSFLVRIVLQTLSCVGQGSDSNAQFSSSESTSLERHITESSEPEPALLGTEPCGEHIAYQKQQTIAVSGIELLVRLSPMEKLYQVQFYSAVSQWKYSQEIGKFDSGRKLRK
jgi:hypothetical protein